MWLVSYYTHGKHVLTTMHKHLPEWSAEYSEFLYWCRTAGNSVIMTRH